MTVEEESFERSNGSSENTPLLYPTLRPTFSYNDDPKNPHHSEYQVSPGQEYLLLKKKSNFEKGSEKKGWRRYIGVFLTLFASFLLSITTLIAKVLIQYHPFNEAMWRFQGILVPSIPILLWVRCAKGREVFEPIYPLNKADKLKTFAVLFIRAFCGCTAVIFQFYALSYIEIGDVTVISFATPVFVTILAYFLLGEKLGLSSIAIALITLIGIGVIARPPFLSGSQGFDPQNLIGVALALGCMSFATFTYVALRWLRNVHYAVVTFFYGFYSVAECLIFALLVGVLEVPQTGEHWMLAIALGVIAFFGQSLFTIALKFEDAGPVALLRTSEVIFTFIWQIMFLSEIPDATSVIGAFLILLSVMLITLQKWIVELPDGHPLKIRFSFLLK